MDVQDWTVLVSEHFHYLTKGLYRFFLRIKLSVLLWKEPTEPYLLNSLPLLSEKMSLYHINMQTSLYIVLKVLITGLKNSTCLHTKYLDIQSIKVIIFLIMLSFLYIHCIFIIHFYSL